MPQDSKQTPIIQLILAVAGVFVIIIGIYFGAVLVNLVLLSLIFTLICVPLVEILKKRGIKRVPAVLIVWLGTGAVVIGLSIFFVLSLGHVMAQAPDDQNTLSARLAELSSDAQKLGLSTGTVQLAANNAAGAIFNFGARILTQVVTGIVFFAFFMLTFGYMLLEAEVFTKRLARWLGVDSLSYQRMGTGVESVVKYIIITTWINLMIGVVDAIFLWIMDIPNPLLWGFLAFVCGYIPYVGYWISFLPPMILAFIQGGIWPAVIITVGYTLINGGISNFVAPGLYGKGLNISPVLVLLTVIFFGALLGPIGAMISVPIVALLKSVVLEGFPETRGIALLMSEGDGAAEQAEAAQDDIVSSGSAI